MADLLAAVPCPCQPTAALTRLDALQFGVEWFIAM